MDVEKRIRTNESKQERTVSEHHLGVQVDTRSYLVACSAKTDQERTACCKLPPCWRWGEVGGGVGVCAWPTRALTPEASRTIFQYSNMQQPLLPGSSVSRESEDPLINPQKAVQPETACTFIHHCLIYVSLVSFYFILYRGKWMLLMSTWFLLVVTERWKH